MIMVFVLMLMPICIILGSVMISNIMSEKHNLRYEKAKGQSFYLAETGLNAAYYAFSATNFSSYTHTKANDDSDPDDAGTQVSSGSTDPTPLTLTSGLTNNIPFKQESDGWYAFRWDPKTDELKDSLTHSGQQEIIRFRVTRTYYAPSVANGRETAWEIVCEATLGTTKKTHRLSGQLEGIATHAIFDAGNLNEFIRGANQNIYGKVHANGDIYLKPSGTTLTVETGTTDPSFTTAGRFWYGKDATGRTNMGTVKVGADSGSIHTWPSKLDSASANWATDVTSLWNDIVKDSALGATVKGVPPVQSFKPDGYYANTAEAGGLRIYDDGGTVKVSSNGCLEQSWDRKTEGHRQAHNFLQRRRKENGQRRGDRRKGTQSFRLRQWAHLLGKAGGADQR